jgi:hypothetical protein
MIRNDKNFWLVALALAVVMFATRLGHFGEYGGPPDASWAVFFLAGLWLRMPRLFPAFFALGWVADLAAFALGTPNLCYSPAYLFLIPAYGALWMAGHWVARRAEGQLARTVLAVPVAALVAFVVANLGMYLLAPSPTATGLTDFGLVPGILADDGDLRVGRPVGRDALVAAPRGSRLALIPSSG